MIASEVFRTFQACWKFFPQGFTNNGFELNDNKENKIRVRSGKPNQKKANLWTLHGTKGCLSEVGVFSLKKENSQKSVIIHEAGNFCDSSLLFWGRRQNSDKKNLFARTGLFRFGFRGPLPDKKTRQAHFARYLLRLCAWVFEGYFWGSGAELVCMQDSEFLRRWIRAFPSGRFGLRHQCDWSSQIAVFFVDLAPCPDPSSKMRIQPTSLAPLHSVNTRGIVKTSGFTKGVCKNQWFYYI